MIDLKLPQDAFHGPHCGVQAVAVVAEKPLRETMEIFRDKCRYIKRMKRWRGSTHHYDRVKVLKHLNIDFKALDTMHTKGVTLNSFVKNIANPNHLYMVTTTSHVQLVKGSQILDQRGLVDASQYWGIRKKISRPVLQII